MIKVPDCGIARLHPVCCSGGGQTYGTQIFHKCLSGYRGGRRGGSRRSRSGGGCVGPIYCNFTSSTAFSRSSGGHTAAVFCGSG